EPMSGESRGDVKARDAGHRADDRMVVGRHLVVAGPRRRHAQVREERMAPRGTRTDPWLERLRNDERRELSGNVGSGRRARTLLDPAVAREIRHREALRGAL